MANNFFTKVANDVLQASEDIVNRMEEGISVLMTGEIPKQQNDAGKPPQESSSIPFDYEEDIDIDNLSEEEIQRILTEEMMENSPLEGIADSVIGDIVAGQVRTIHTTREMDDTLEPLILLTFSLYYFFFTQLGPSTPMEHFHAFRSAITWSETFILSLVAFQIVMFFLVLWVSRKDRSLTARIGVMMFIGALVRSAEWLNSLGGRNWERFSTQNYFDKKGIFVGIMLCGPLLVDCLIMLLMFVKEAGQLLIEVKKEQLTRKKGKKEKKNNEKKRSTKTRKQD